MMLSVARRAATRLKNVFPRGLKEVIHDLVRSHGKIAGAATDRQSIGAGSCHRSAVEVGKEGIDHGDVSTAAELNALGGFVLWRAMQPHTIKNEMVCGYALCQRNQGIDDPADWACDFQTN